MASTEWFCYLLECADGTLYAGITTAVDRRLSAHNLGSASKYTRARRPVRVVHTEAWPDRSSATRRELALKKLPRAAKQALVRKSARSGKRSSDYTRAAGARPPSSWTASQPRAEAASRSRSAAGRPTGSKR
jgi:putative endonuclease